MRTLQGSLLSVALSAAACTAAPSENNAAEATLSSTRLAMMKDDGVDCSTCVGAECVDLHCFETWTHNGGGGGGPWSGPGGGPFGGGGGPATGGGGATGGSSGGASSSGGSAPPDDSNCLEHCGVTYADCVNTLGADREPECLRRAEQCIDICHATATDPTLTPKLSVRK